MSKGNKGLWNSSRKLLLLAAMAVATAIPLRAQTLYGATLDLTSGAQLSSGSVNFYSSGTLAAGNSNFGSATSGHVYISHDFNSGTFTFSGLDAPPVQLTKTGAGTVILSGSNANTYSGATTVSGGILQINPPIDSLPPLNSGGTIQLNASTLTYSGYVPYSGTIVNGGTLLLSSAVSTVPTTADEEEAVTPTAPATLTLSAIPEPSTLGLLIVASLSAGLIRSRSKLK